MPASPRKKLNIPPGIPMKEVQANGVSVVICCYNSAALLPETLRHLAVQKRKTFFAWEVLVVVDAATTDDTAGVIESFKPQFPPGQLRMVYESKRGLGYARIKGAREARYEYISYVDDDNWVAADWVDTVHQSFSNLPKAAVIGGRGEPVFENGTGPAWFNQFARAYAVGDQYNSSGDITDKPPGFLWGAGLGIRKSVWEALFQSGFELSVTEVRLGKKLFALTPRANEDADICDGVCAMGGRLFYVPELTYKHFMPRGRLNWSSLRRVFSGQGRSGIFTQNLRAVTDRSLSPMKLKLERNWLFQVVRILRHLSKIALRNPASMVTQAEGSADRLQTDVLLGQLGMFLRLRGRYAVFFDENRARYAKSQR